MGKKTPIDPTLSREAAALERRDLQKTHEQRQEVEATAEIIHGEIGKLIDAAREDPDLVIDEEDTSVRRLAKRTGRSGTQPAVRVPENSKPG